MQMKSVVLILAAILLLAVPAMADQVGLGGAWVDGHSEDGSYGVNNKGDQSWGVHFNYDKDVGWKKMLGDHNAIGIDPSMQLFYLHWTKTINGEKTTCKYRKNEWPNELPDVSLLQSGDDCYYGECKTEKTYKTQNVDSLIMGVGPKAYLALGRFQIYALGALGYALQDGAQDDLAAIAQVGALVQITKNFGMSLDHSEIWVNPDGRYDRFDATSLNAVLFW